MSETKETIANFSEDVEKLLKNMYFVFECRTIINKVIEAYPTDDYIQKHICFELGVIAGKRMERAKRHERTVNS